MSPERATLLEGATEFDTGPLGFRSYLSMSTHALWATLIGLLVMSSIEPNYGALLSLFLTAAALSRKSDEILERNRVQIWEAQRSSFETNRESALSYLALFIGIFIAYLGATLWLGSEATPRFFAFALRTAALGHDSLSTRSFGDFFALFGHNLAVLSTFVSLAFLYRGYGTLLALAWNAAVWSIALSELTRRAVTSETGRFINATWVTLVSMISLLPHLVFEASAYVAAALAGTFLSLGLSKYGLRDPRLVRVLRASALMVVTGILLLGLAALAESQYAPRTLRALLPPN